VCAKLSGDEVQHPSQFLIEAVVLTAIGGLAGLAVGEIASLLMNKYSPLPAYVPLWAIGSASGSRRQSEYFSDCGPPGKPRG
jgi:hypothetical protein